MKKEIVVGLRISKNQESILLQQAKDAGFRNISSHIKFLVVPAEKTLCKTTKDFRNKRIERRSFSCYFSLWEKILELTADKKTASQFIREAIEEKIKKESLKASGH